MTGRPPSERRDDLRRHARARVAWRLGIGGGAGVLLAFMLLPLVALVATSNIGALIAGLGHPLVWPALKLSLTTTTISLALVVLFGTPLAWLFARGTGRALAVLETVVRLPVVLPPAVAGVALLLAFGRLGLLGGVLGSLGLNVPFTTAAVVLAEVFVSAPFYVQAAAAAFRGLDDAHLTVARSLGASPARVFFRVALPIAAPGLVAGAAMSWARALGEFGATLMFAGNLTGKTQTLTLAIYTTFESDLEAAQSISVVMVVVAFSILWLLSSRFREVEA